MQIHTDTLPVSTQGLTDVHDLSPAVQEQLNRSGLREGTVTLFVPGSTAGLTTIEYEPGLLKDMPEMFEKFAPQEADYHHHQTRHCRG